MEVARSGMFNPALFTFHEIMILYVSVMFANVILLDIYNSLGLPTSTTVSLIFCLLGSAVAVSLFKIGSDPTISFAELGEYINTTRAMGVVSGILLSVILAFAVGTFVMWISRTIFSFRYMKMLRRLGAVWCGVSLTSILYFAVFKGLKSLLKGTLFVEWVNEHLLLALAGTWVACSLFLFFLQLFRVNILRVTILAGTFSLALAFAGNDLVNFIGVPIAGLEAFQESSAAGGDVTILMDALAVPSSGSNSSDSGVCKISSPFSVSFADVSIILLPLPSSRASYPPQDERTAQRANVAESNLNKFFISLQISQQEENQSNPWCYCS